jgi:hypothetical protein
MPAVLKVAVLLPEVAPDHSQLLLGKFSAVAVSVMLPGLKLPF